jgi:hypothetical protein
MGSLGLIINLLINLGGITAEVILAGLLSGLASTGTHNLYKAFKEAVDSGGEEEV